MEPESKITFEIPSSLDLDSFIKSNNYTLLFSTLHTADSGNTKLVKDIFSNRSKTMNDIEYERFMNEVWITLVMVLLILSIVFCLCSCMLYHKFRQWKRSVAVARANATVTNNLTIYESDHDSLPSYTLVSGLPSYDDALEQMKSKLNKTNNNNSQKRPSLTRLFHLETEKANVDITNYQAPRYDDAATSDPSYEVSVILPQKSTTITHEKSIPIKPLYGMEPITDIPSHILNESDSFIINLPLANTATEADNRHKQEHSKLIYKKYDILTPEIHKERKLKVISSMKTRANSVGNLCDIHR